VIIIVARNDNYFDKDLTGRFCGHCIFACTMPNRSNANSRSQGLLNTAAKAIGRSLPLMISGVALTAGAGSLLMAGSAQAAWTSVPGGYSCSFDGGCTIDEKTPNPPVGGDKFLTLLNWGSISEGSDLEFSYQPGDPTTPWHVDLDFNPDDSDGGFLSYKIEATGGSFNLVKLLSTKDETNTVTKTYGTSLLPDGYTVDPTSVIDTLKLIGEDGSESGTAYGSVLYVNDSWQPPGAIDNISNEYAQHVPGPLPLLGAGAAFGFSRKLRRRLKGVSLARG
jgi:hypothetical protein